MLDHYHKNSASFNATSTDKHSLSCMPNTFSDFIYSGERDEALMRKGMGCNNAKKDNLWETYIGNFVLDNEHGDGTFKWKTDQGDFAYEGYVFCNHITGYGRFSYPDGSMHEGLYKSNCRFGPGVYTEPSGRQSVGIWQNKKLVRLTIKVETGVPTLATTPQGKAKILGYRNILFIDKGVSDKAKEILMEMNAPSHILNISECLYNIYGKDNRSLNFNWPLYNKIFSPTIRAQKPSIVSIAESIISGQINRSIKSESKFTKKKLKQATLKETKIIIDTERRKREFDTLMQNATHLISWNNSPIMEEILLYCFKHYHQEDIITYNLADVLKNRRSHFRAPGIHETLCVRFLKRCHVGDHWRVDDYLAFKAIDPNVADCEGNTGLITAAKIPSLKMTSILESSIFFISADKFDLQCTFELNIPVDFGRKLSFNMNFKSIWNFIGLRMFTSCISNNTYK